MAQDAPKRRFLSLDHISCFMFFQIASYKTFIHVLHSVLFHDIMTTIPSREKKMCYVHHLLFQSLLLVELLLIVPMWRLQPRGQ